MSRRLFSTLILLAVAVLGLQSFSGVLLAQGRSEEALQRAIAAQEKHTKVLMAKEGIEGTAVGLDDNDRFVVKIYTERPGVANIPDNLENVPVQVEVTGKFVARLSTTDRWPRPVPIGISTGHPAITAGTIGCRVTDGEIVYALSNNHVYANQNDASLGDYVIQPGTYDGGSLPDDYLGQLYDFEPIDFSGGDNTFDAAIAILTTDLLSVATPSDGYGTPGKAIVSAGLGMSVQKYGRTTGWTHGQISGINVTVNVCYEPLGPFCLKQARFVHQITITPGGFSGGGDSGSLIVTDDSNKNPVGLLFAGSDTMTIANLIGPVLARFGVTVDDGSSQEPVAPVANFQGSPTSGNAPLTVNFTDLSTGNPTSWSWDFDGDGAEDAAIKNPSHTYNTPGSYTVTLTVANDVGSDTETKTGYITVTEQAQEPPVADFSASPTSGDAPLTVSFTDLSSGNPTSWSWDFDSDGIEDATAQNPSYTYSTSGVYTVTLTATNANGSDDEMKVDYINVNAPSSGPLVADFEGSPTSGGAPLAVHFTDLSSGEPISWGWDFGDGIGASFEQNPSYTYNWPGQYNVTLIVMNLDFEMDMVTKYSYITVTGQTGNPPIADFSATPTSGEAPLAVQFTDLSTNNPTSWSWDFGDGIGTSSAQNPSYEYASVGTYTVELTAANSYGSDTVTKVDYITVDEPSVEITLTAVGYKVRGRKTTDLEWSGATGGNVEIYRDGVLIVTTENDGFYTDATESRGGGSFTYQVCEIGGSPCSNVVTVYY